MGPGSKGGNLRHFPQFLSAFHILLLLLLLQLREKGSSRQSCHMAWQVKQRWDWLVLGWVTAIGQKEMDENFSIPFLLSCGVAMKSANRSVLC